MKGVRAALENPHSSLNQGEGSSAPWRSGVGLPAGVGAGASVEPLSSEQGPLVPGPGTAAAQPVYLETAGLYL